ncbi:aldehyde dehydrogenase family protein [Mycoplasma suis]|uniref:NADP-dependent glyceraldehyde-3-phosphate dehydrogenase n=1 Tax=Mycoplasma suis (strain Illinois) TaxID=768700 RepID=F0QQ03_MYCSL|nr:aldehyde dehydrogenase family protein [Mycoplasma suis]ADX97573.1 NADP-dependent glyceraldehyde-3-phosphate dehydrogenase [Mycoplasma suis str. Illinois]
MSQLMYKIGSFIDGELVAPEELQKMEVFSPLTQECIGVIPLLDRERTRQIFKSSKEAFKKWSQLDYDTREKFLFLFSSKLQENSRELSQVISLESGKSKEDSLDEIKRSCEYISETIHFFNAIMRNPREYNSEKYPLLSEELQALYFRVPLGVILSITPFNYPLNTMITKIVPALLMGNSVIQKSSINGSLTGYLVSKIFNELSIDGYLVTPGVLNYYTGRGSTLESFIREEKPEISALSFTGSSDAGFSIASALPGIPQALELSALNTALVLDDAELSTSVSEILKGTLKYSGQRCTSIKLVFVPKHLEKEFKSILIRELSSFKLDNVPIINKASLRKIEEAYKDALSKGAHLITAPINWGEQTSLVIPPLVFFDVKQDMLVSHKEIFGPILSVISYTDLEEAISQINNLGYGLQASIFSKDIKVAGEIALKIDVGRVNLNLAPARSPDLLPFPSSRKSGNSEQGIINSLYFFSKFRGIVFKESKEEIKD